MRAERLLTAEEFWALPDVPGKRYELVRGVPVEIRAAGAVQGLITARLATLLFTFVSARDLGYAFADGVD